MRVREIAIDLTNEVNKLIKRFPPEEKFVLAQQMQRASDSLELNIADGSTGQSNAEFKKFLGYSIRSGIEVVSGLFIGQKRNIISEEDFPKLYTEYESLITKLQTLRKSIN